MNFKKDINSFELSFFFYFKRKTKTTALLKSFSLRIYINVRNIPKFKSNQTCTRKIMRVLLSFNY